MIVGRAPYRVSFLGGGTDYPEWYLQHGGEVLAAAIDKYCWLSCRLLPPFFAHRHRIAYSVVETCNSLDEIKHPAVREGLRCVGEERGIELHHDGDLPARSGMGSSSAFAVGLILVLRAMRGFSPLTKLELAGMAINLERELLREHVGAQDQVTSAHGGFNHVRFREDGRIEVEPVEMSDDDRDLLQRSLMLFHTGHFRSASAQAGKFLGQLSEHRSQLRDLKAMVGYGVDALRGGDLVRFGRLLAAGWMIKRGMVEVDPEVEAMRREAMAAGALGCKLLGAGLGGFLLTCSSPECKPAIRDRLRGKTCVPFGFDDEGAKIVFQQTGTG